MAPAHPVATGEAGHSQVEMKREVAPLGSSTGECAQPHQKALQTGLVPASGLPQPVLRTPCCRPSVPLSPSTDATAKAEQAQAECFVLLMGCPLG